MSSKPILNAYEHTAPTTGWNKSAYSDHGNACVEWQLVGEQVLIRDSKYQGSEDLRPIIAVPANAWDTFLARAIGDEHNNDAVGALPIIKFDPTSAETSLVDAAGTMLTFTVPEWDAFTRSICTQQWQPTAA
ncbi:DUF397 domain-containing protein [Nocardia sp. CA2R105]|uniref:DUF397 domain-containing protein n=1 Tax=Nocardia coffeae TaxID=2873381 RepID=UPI001CA65076|nr:DUF397 domain-containing protein [Nocardia coffeae]MBY8855406.1 DUF397 domain-containing protein [Nocardia coffeae]